MWATGYDNCASIHSAVNEYLAIDRDGNCTLITCGALKACKRVLTFEDRSDLGCITKIFLFCIDKERTVIVCYSTDRIMSMVKRRC